MTSISLLQSSLELLGYTTRCFMLGETKKSFTQFTAPDGERSITFSTDSPLYPFASASARLIANDKDMAYDLAERTGITIPRSVTIKSTDTEYIDALALLQTSQKVIVKPASSSMSKGLTLNIADETALVEAIATARQHSDTVLVQQQVTGDEIRFVVVDGIVRASILRQTPRVTGDGVRTLGQLIEQENLERSQIRDTSVSYPQLDGDVVNLSGFDMESIPADGECIELGLGTMIKYGASIYNVHDTVDKSYHAIVERLAGQLAPGFVVVDMMLVDYTQSATSKNYAFIEYNLTPALPLFYSCRDGKHFDAAGEYLAPMIDAVIREKQHD